jgi:3-hydroxyacyl-[acyl-carrier-protein] dehydratase
MLTNDFCAVLNLETGPGEIRAVLQWNKSHPIFQGHFPGQPVVPGVCMLQLVKEVLEKVIGNSLVLLESSQMKFLQFIDPGVTESVDILIRYTTAETGAYSVNAALQKDQQVYFKCSGMYLPSETNKGEV